MSAQNNCKKYQEDYIPIDLTEAIAYFKCKTSKDDLNTFKNQEEDRAIGLIHLSTGMSIRNNWGLWAGTSEISKYFRDLGIHHPDDMSSIILTSLHRELNDKPIGLSSQIQFYKDFWAESKRKRTERQLKKFGEFDIGDKVEFLYTYDFVSKRQEEKYMEDKCLARGVVVDMNKEKLELKVKLKKSCDRKGIIIEKYDVWSEIDGENKKVKEGVIEIMKRGETRWTPFDLWEVLD